MIMNLVSTEPLSNMVLKKPEKERLLKTLWSIEKMPGTSISSPLSSYFYHQSYHKDLSLFQCLYFKSENASNMYIQG